MILIAIIYFSFFLFTWYSDKLMPDLSGVTQYWHIPQMLFLIVVYLLPFFFTYDLNYLVLIASMGLQFPFIFNSGLNAYRGLPITHLGRYDFLKFYQTVILFLIGLITLIIVKVM
jgi:hypothetical protein